MHFLHIKGEKWLKEKTINNLDMNGSNPIPIKNTGRIHQRIHLYTTPRPQGFVKNTFKSQNQFPPEYCDKTEILSEATDRTWFVVKATVPYCVWLSLRQWDRKFGPWDLRIEALIPCKANQHCKPIHWEPKPDIILIDSLPGKARLGKIKWISEKIIIMIPSRKIET